MAQAKKRYKVLVLFGSAGTRRPIKISLKN